MNDQALLKLIQATLIPMFPFVVKVDVKRITVDGKVGVRVIYHVDFDYTSESRNEMYNQTYDMFKLIGFPRGVTFAGISIYPKKILDA